MIADLRLTITARLLCLLAIAGPLMAVCAAGDTALTIEHSGPILRPAMSNHATDATTTEAWEESAADEALDNALNAILQVQHQAPSKTQAITPAPPRQSASSAPELTPPPTPAEPLSPSMLALQKKLRRVLEMYQSQRQNTSENNCWELMHSIVAYGVKSEVLRGGSHGLPVNSVGWLCYNGVCKNDRLLTVKDGRVSAKWGVGVQGHQGQFLAIMAQSRVPASFPMKVDGRSFTVSDLIESEKYTCETGIELTFKLISLAHYLDTDETWDNFAGKEWSIPQLIQEEIKAPIRGAACGGTHRLMGLSYAVRKREIEGRSIDGQYARAQKYLNDYHQYTFSLQNVDGSFSTEWFTRRADKPDVNRRIQTTGHILEWMAYSLSKEKLDDPRVLRAVHYLANTLQGGSQRQWEIGPLGHALHSLLIYEDRRFNTPTPKPALDELANQPAPTPKADAPEDEALASPVKSSRTKPHLSNSEPTEPAKTEPAKTTPAEVSSAADKPPTALGEPQPLPEWPADAKSPRLVAPQTPGSVLTPRTVRNRMLQQR